MRGGEGGDSQTQNSCPLSNASKKKSGKLYILGNLNVMKKNNTFEYYIFDGKNQEIFFNFFDLRYGDGSVISQSGSGSTTL